MRRRLCFWAVVASVTCAVTGIVPLATASAASPGPKLLTVRAARPARTTAVPPQPADCCGPTVANVPKVGGDYGDQDYSNLAQITMGDIRFLRGAWVDHLDNTAVATAQESTPVAVDGNLYIQTGQGDIFAINGATGKILWKFSSGLVGTERGVAVGNVGPQPAVFSALGNENVVALNRTTGHKIWQVQVGTAQDNTTLGGATEWTLFYHGLVLVGTDNGGGTGLRAHVYALNASDGSVKWSFGATTPGTWSGTSWEVGGADSWIAPAVDPQLGLIYVTFGNAKPRGDGIDRVGDDLYANSIVALNWSTGKLAWFFQGVHHDLWDLDDVMFPLIADVRYGGTVRKVVVYGSKSDHLYYLDAKTGKPVLPVKEVSEPVSAGLANSPTQPIPQGDPLVPTCAGTAAVNKVVPGYKKGCEFAAYGNKPVVISPGRGGGANWAPMSFDRKTGLIYVPASEQDTAYSTGQPYGQPLFWEPAGELRGGVLDAINPQTGRIVWQRPTTFPRANGDGVLTTASGLLFEGSPGGLFEARSASSGKVLWNWQTGEGIATTPITYEANGKQYVSIFACANSVPCNLWSFRLNGKVKQAKAPAKPPVRVLVSGPSLAGSNPAVKDTVVMGQTWDTTNNAPSGTEDLGSEIAMAPPIMTVTVGTKVTFENPVGNTQSHCAQSFFDPAKFKIGPLAPGQSRSFTFTKRGTYFYNDCAGFPWNTGEIIVH
jgi:PQQ-dependent dehydrogenase (methanol/ethanol family)